MKKGDNCPKAFIGIRVEVVAEEEDMFLPQVLLDGLHPKVTAVYVWYDNHHYLRHKRGEPDKELLIDSTWALILNRFRDTLIQILSIDQYNMDIKRLIIPATMRRTPITRLP